MPMSLPREPRSQDVTETAKGSMKCRIPQRLPPNRAQPLPNYVAIPKTNKASNFPETRQKCDVISTVNSRFGTKNSSRPRSENARPKSANRSKEEPKHRHPPQRPPRPNEKVLFTAKRLSTLHKTSAPERVSRPITTVQMTSPQRTTQRTAEKILCQFLDQEYKRRDNDLELQLSQSSPGGTSPMTSPTSPRFEQSEEESIISRGENLGDLKVVWQEKMIQFEHMKDALKEQQKDIMGLYAQMREIHQKMLSLGANASLPPAEDLRIMNVANMTPEQLLQLCAGDDLRRKPEWDVSVTQLPIDINKLYEMPSKLVDTCEQTLAKRKDVINWFETLKSTEKGISVQTLSKKINEFNEENDMLKCSLDKVKADFLKQLEEIVNMIRKGINETMGLVLRNEELTYELSELNSQNADLRKQIYNSDHLRSIVNKTRFEELEKELKEEKCKRLVLRDRLSRSEGQLKINVERALQLEATLEQARSQIWSLEQTVQQLHEQNQKLQSDFDKELNKLTESIREHTVHLEEIADAREKLQSEKEDLESRLTELSACYKESIQNMKLEMKVNLAKLLETEKKCSEQEEDKQKLQEKLETLCAELLEVEQRHKNTLQQLNEKETLLNQEIKTHKELEEIKLQLEKANKEIYDNKEHISKQNDTIKYLEMSLKEAMDSTENHKTEVSTKNEYITELEKKQAVLEQQLQDNENKIETYLEQLSSLKTHINQLQEDFGEFDNLGELHDMINQQRAKLLEATRENEELAESLQKKDKELQQYSKGLLTHEKLLLEREDVIKMLSEKEVEQTNIIKILRNNLELRTQADNELSQQIMEKNTEIDTLLVNLETRKQQISNMEKIILTLEDQTRKASLHRKKDQEHIMRLQKRIAEYESLRIEATRNLDSPENLDSLIKILEDELGTPVDNDLSSNDHSCNRNLGSKKKYHGDHKYDKLDCDEDLRSLYQPEPDAQTTKIVKGGLAKGYTVAKEKEDDNLNYKNTTPNFSRRNQIRESELGPDFNVPSATKENARRSMPVSPQHAPFTRNFQFLNLDQQRDDRKHKMFKLAGHRLYH